MAYINISKCIIAINASINHNNTKANNNRNARINILVVCIVIFYRYIRDRHIHETNVRYELIFFIISNLLVFDQYNFHIMATLHFEATWCENLLENCDIKISPCNYKLFIIFTVRSGFSRVYFTSCSLRL